MARALWIPDKLREYGLEVVEEPGWQSRGADYLSARGVVGHHTAGSASGDMPSLGILINGRSDLPGPLCHVGLSRSGKCHVIASGVANHAGSGSWKTLSGNSSVLGIEAENTGTGEAWKNYDQYVLCAAALLDGLGATADYFCGHKEWAPSRKIDPFGLDMNDMRTAIAVALKNKGDWLMGAKEDIMAAIFKSTVVNLKAHQKTLQAEWVTRRLLREAGVLPEKGDEDSQLEKDLAAIQKELKDLGAD